MNRISNGGFIGDLANWTLSGGAAYVANQGHDELGAAHLPAPGAAISQQFAVPVARPQMIDVWLKAAGADCSATLTITNADGDTVYTASLAASSSWANALGQRVGLPQGNFTFEVAYDDGAVYVDDISLAWVIKTRLELATACAGLLGDLATSDAGYITTPNGEFTEGDYTSAVDYGLRQVGAIDLAGDTDPAMLDADSVDACIDEIQRHMLHKLHRYYTRHATDFTLEGRTEHYNQRVKGIENLLGIAVGGRPSASGRAPKMGNLRHGSGL